MTFEQGSDGKPEMEIGSNQKHSGPHLAEGGSTSMEVEAKPEQLDNGTSIMASTSKLDDDVEAGGCQNFMFNTFPLLQFTLWF